ncbi:LacI family DNA-binding transcriptional regulator [Rhizobium jaguaris]|uniref:LacI family DNA-binding transcriptional regulator n=1 Tax=Rhizobium jaguaris TaxID=1312183 RepID=A0A387FEG2_9HYPH|nr:LacI family DNA-binding transcriptional regulator [Rhizobium jaguaris]AYG57550.1 LacI family DNA-binding transcriptional regulator [Rhizobium jaguaris]
MSDQTSWKGPTIAEIAKFAGVGTATVDRVLNGRNSVKEATRVKVMDAVSRLTSTPSSTNAQPRQRVIHFLSDSGTSYNRSLELAAVRYQNENPTIECTFEGVNTSEVHPVSFAQKIERAAGDCDGLVVVAREDLTINRALRNVSKKIPLVCLTTDLPNSGRLAYVGNDQTIGGATAAHLMGRLVGQREGKILIVFSAPYRVQEERELGFRRVLRSDFSYLDIEDRLNSNDDGSYSHKNLMQYIESHGPPLGIYNVAGGNFGIGQAIEESGLASKTVFIGHELNSNSRTLLETGLMDIVIGHDVHHEVVLAVRCIEAALDRNPLPTLSPTEIKIYTKYNCSI